MSPSPAERAEDLRRHAVGTAEIALVRDRDAQVAERPSAAVLEDGERLRLLGDDQHPLPFGQQR